MHLQYIWIIHDFSCCIEIETTKLNATIHIYIYIRMSVLFLVYLQTLYFPISLDLLIVSFWNLIVCGPMIAVGNGLDHLKLRSLAKIKFPKSCFFSKPLFLRFLFWGDGCIYLLWGPIIFFLTCVKEFQWISQLHLGIAFIGSSFFYPTTVTTRMKHWDWDWMIFDSSLLHSLTVSSCNWGPRSKKRCIKSAVFTLKRW